MVIRTTDRHSRIRKLTTITMVLNSNSSRIPTIRTSSHLRIPEAISTTTTRVITIIRISSSRSRKYRAAGNRMIMMTKILVLGQILIIITSNRIRAPLVAVPLLPRQISRDRLGDNSSGKRAVAEVEAAAVAVQRPNLLLRSKIMLPAPPSQK